MQTTRLLPVARCQAILLRCCRGGPSVSRRLLCSASTPHQARFLAPSEEATGDLASLLAQQRRPGDCLCLNGEVGSGKSAFSRAYIRAVEDDDLMPVPSPTYLLQNVYEYDDGPWVYHYDLYRLQSGADLQRLDLQDSLRTGVNLVEWPARLAELTPPNRLDVLISLVDPADEEAALKQKLVTLDEAGADEGEAGAYEDHRWRSIALNPHGHHWFGVVKGIVDNLRSSDIKGACRHGGLTIVPEELRKASSIAI